MSREVVIKTKDDMNAWCRTFMADALEKYGMNPREWARQQGVCDDSIGDWMNGRRELSIDLLTQIVARIGCKLTLTPPAKLPEVKEKRRKVHKLIRF